MKSQATIGRQPATVSRALRLLLLSAACCCVVVTPAWAASWYDASFPIRRALDLVSDPSRIDADDTAVAEFYAPGVARPDGSDIRIAADDGTPVPMRLLQFGPGDRVRVVFNPKAGRVRHYAYWGNKSDQLPPPKPAVMNAGLLVETRKLGPLDQRNLPESFQRAGELMGTAVIDRLFLGYNPVALDAGPTISRITGTLYSPADGEYQIAGSIDDRGLIRLDGKDFLNVPGFPADARFQRTISLPRGPHPIEVYHVDHGGDWRVSVGWKRPDSPRIEPIAADSFGRMTRVKVGPLEQHRKQIVADVQFSHLGEAIIDNHSSYRIRFETPTHGAKNVRVAWDFGDGQTATGERVEHVFLQPGVYTVKVTLRSVQADDTRTCRLVIGRDPMRITDPQLDDFRVQAAIIATYDPSRLSPTELVQATRLCALAGEVEPMLKMLSALCAVERHPDQPRAIDAITSAIATAEGKQQAAALAEALRSLSPTSNLHPKAATLHANVLLWRVGDYKAAAKMLEPFMSRPSNNLKRLRMTALLLDQQPDEAKKILEQLPDEGDAPKKVALSGAMARSIEYFIDQGDLESAEEQWDEWQRRFPSTLFDGYAAILRARMLHKSHPAEAAKAAEAFALALPASPYAPQLLDFAANTLAKSDAPRAEKLRQLLKEKYPEDPLAQQ